jgi:hypothetical protein
VGTFLKALLFRRSESIGYKSAFTYLCASKNKEYSNAIYIRYENVNSDFSFIFSMVVIRLRFVAKGVSICRHEMLNM